MERLYLPPSLRYFTPLRVENGSPGDHACFEYDLVEALRPKLVVDLGAGNALSFTVLCQSMKDHDVDGLAYAVDLWECDEQREAEGVATWTRINNFVHTEFRAFAYLLKQSPEQALMHFEDGSVDLIRIDPRRAERPLSQLLDAWSPKVKPGGALLCAGVTEWPRALDDWALQSPDGVVFPHAGGLGVRVLPATTTGRAQPPLLRWIAASNESSKQRLVAFYEHAASHHFLKLEIQEQGDILFRKGKR